MNNAENKYWPCILVEHDDRFSIILSEFHLLDDYFGDKGCGGYSVERLARKLVKKHRIVHIQRNKMRCYSYVPCLLKLQEIKMITRKTINHCLYH